MPKFERSGIIAFLSSATVLLADHLPIMPEFPSSDELVKILDRILNGSRNENDINLLRHYLSTVNSKSQLQLNIFEFEVVTVDYKGKETKRYLRRALPTHLWAKIKLLID